MKVTVIIPVFNAASFLDQSIQSALDQFQTGEVILIDDRSTDGTWEKCEAWVRKDKRVRLSRNEGMKGAGAARNVGLRNATCEYIAFLDADDYYLQGRFEEDEIIFVKNPNICATANCIEIKTFDGSDQISLNEIYKNKGKISFKESYKQVDIDDFFKGSALHLNGLTVRKSIIEKAGEFDENLKQAQDTDFQFRLFLTGDVMTTDINTIKGVYNIHRTNTITNIPEAVFYRRKLAKKLFHSALNYHLSVKLIWKFFIQFMEYDYLWSIGRNHSFKKIIKALIIPYFVFQIYSKNDPEYDKDRTIHLS